MRCWLSLRASARRAELFVYDEIGSNWSANPVTARTVREELNRLGDVDELTVRINSVGGVVTEGMAIYSMLRELKARKTVVVEGIAASIASVVAMAGDRVVMTKGSYLMVHNPFAFAEGGAEDLRRTADLLDKMRADILSVYAEATGLAPDVLGAMVDAETYLTAEEAVEKGFADEVADYGARIAASARGLKNAPEALRKALSAKGSTMTEEEIDKLKAALKAAEEECASLKAKVAKLEGSDDEGSDDDAEEQSPEDSAAVARLVAACVAATGEQDLVRLEGAVMALAGKAPQARKDVVAKAVADGKLVPALRAWAMSCPKAALDAFLKSAPVSIPSSPATEPAPGAEAHAPSAEGRTPAPAPSATELTKAEAHVASLMGLSKAQALAARGSEVRLAGPAR